MRPTVNQQTLSENPFTGIPIEREEGGLPCVACVESLCIAGAPFQEFDALARGYTALPAGESQKRREAAAELRAGASAVGEGHHRSPRRTKSRGKVGMSAIGVFRRPQFYPYALSTCVARISNMVRGCMFRVSEQRHRHQCHFLRGLVLDPLGSPSKANQATNSQSEAPSCPTCGTAVQRTAEW